LDALGKVVAHALLSCQHHPTPTPSYPSPPIKLPA
jgi:hypothetical protein